MPSVNNIKMTIGGPESPAGTEAAREFVIPIRSVPSLDNQVERAEDPAINGRNMASGEFAMAENAGGSIPLALRPCGGVGSLYKSLLGSEDVPLAIGALIKLKYIGTSASCKIEAIRASSGIVCGSGGDGNANYDGAYFLISNGATMSYIWTNLADGSDDPGGESGVLHGRGYTGVEVAVATDDTTDEIAAAIEAEIEDITGLASEVATSTITVTATTGYTVTALAGSAVFTVTNASTLKSSIGTLGAESVDSAFGTAGVIDLSGATFDTVGELVAAVDAYTYYSCEKVFGNDATKMEAIIPIASAQGKGRWVYLWVASAASTAYLHRFAVDLTNTERPTYTIQKDGYQDNFVYPGCVVDSISLSGALKAMIEADCEVLGFDETGEETASELSLEDVDPLMFYSGSTSFGNNDYSYIRNLSCAVANNHNPDGYGQGEIGRQYHEKGKFEVTGDMQVRLDATSYAERVKKFSGDLASASFLFTGEDLLTNIPALVLYELPYVTMSNFEYVENNGVFDAKMTYRAVYPKGTVYGSPFVVSMVTVDSEAY